MNTTLHAFSITGETVYPLGVGTQGHGHTFGGIRKEECFEILDMARKNLPDRSKLLIDTAPRYGHGTVETWLGEFLATDCDRFLIATKGGRHIEQGRDNEKDFSPDFLRFDLHNSLTRLRMHRIFLYQLHNPSLDIIRSGGVFETLEQFRQEKLIEWYGVSINDPDEGIAAIQVCKENHFEGLVALQVIYSILNKHNLERLFQLARDNRIAIMTREVLLRGFLSGKYDMHSQFPDSRPAVTKLVRLYGKNALIGCVKEVERAVTPFNMSLAQAAIRFSVANPFVTVTLVGINRPRYFAEDWISLDVPFPSELLATLNRIEDIHPLP